MFIGGRIMTSSSSSGTGFGGVDYTSQWPGTYFRAAFKGSKVFFRVGKNNEIIHIVADNSHVATLTRPAPDVYEIQGLSNAKHEVSVFIATESQASPNTFGGFAIPKGEKALAPPKRHREIEFIGDSHTVGYGDISVGKQTCTEDEVWANTDSTRSFGPIIAAHYDADYSINAISGRGVVRNYNGVKLDTLPEAYPYVLFDKGQQYNDPSWKPQLIVVSLGANDFSTPLHPGEAWKTRDELREDFEVAYANFLAALRAQHHQAQIIVWATDLAQNEIAEEAQKAVERRIRAGDSHISLVLVSNLSLSGCNMHPSVQDEQIIANKIERSIAANKLICSSK